MESRGNNLQSGDDCLLDRVIRETTDSSKRVVSITSTQEFFNQATVTYDTTGPPEPANQNSQLEEWFDEVFYDTVFFLEQFLTLSDTRKRRDAIEWVTDRLEKLLDVIQEQIDDFFPYLREQVVQGKRKEAITAVFVLSSVHKNEAEPKTLNDTLRAFEESENLKLEQFVEGLKIGRHPAIRSKVQELSLKATSDLREACIRVLDCKDI